jgi:hypothetical protein
MLGRNAPLSVAIVAETLVLRRHQPGVPALDVLDQVMRGRHGRYIDFGDLALPITPFSLVVAEALDTGMLASDWAGLWTGNTHPRLRSFLRELWTAEVWPKFVVRYSLYRAPAHNRR